MLKQKRAGLTVCSVISSDLWIGAVNVLAAKNNSLSFKNAVRNSTAVCQKFFRKLVNDFFWTGGPCHLGAILPPPPLAPLESCTFSGSALQVEVVAF